VTCPVRKLAQFSSQETYPFDASLVATNLDAAFVRNFSVSEPEPLGASQLDVELIRQIDVVCRRFEADWRAGARPPFDSYLAEVPDQARSALRVELEAMERELQQSEEAVSRREPSTESEAATMAPAESPTHPIPGLDRPSIHGEAILAPGDQATIDHEPGSRRGAPESSRPRVRYFGDYEVIREIARGGMGVVFQARQVSLNRPVALKMILAGQLANQIEVKRFYTEAEAAANLDHSGIVPIYEVGQHEGQHYFSMGFVEGQSLSHRLAEGPLPPREAAELMAKVAEAIEYAHQRGVIHRDLKPANILLDKNGNPRVTDFGLAKKVEGDSGLTASGQIMGTPSYMPPEQAGGKRGAVGPVADVYSLGATLYATLTGRPPFQAATAMDTVIQVISDEPVPPRRLNSSIPRDLETITLKCLEKDPVKRFGSARELIEDVKRFLAGERILSSSRRLEPAPMGKWLILGAILGAMAFAMLGAVGWPPQSWIPTPVTSPETPLIGRSLGGALLGTLAAAIAVVLWNTIAVPAWILPQTTAPLAKAALGLGLIFNGLVLVIVPDGLFHDIEFAPGRVIRVSLMLHTMGILCTVLGPILCLEIAPKARSGGVLLWAVTLAVSALVIGANPDLNVVHFKDGTFSWSALLAIFALPLFLVFFRRLARLLERSDLEPRASTVLRLMACCTIGVGMLLVSFYLTSLVGDTELAQRIAALMQLVGTLTVWVLAVFSFLSFFSLIRLLQAEITQRL
jgi:hypothetical protein